MQITRLLHGISVLLGVFFFAVSGHSADWPAWRGVDGLGVSSETNLPKTWSDTENIAWKTEIPGEGASSPVIVDGKVYLTTQIDDRELRVVRIDANSGQLDWNTKVAVGSGTAHQIHNMATPSVVADGERVWAYFRNR